jgi:serine protease
MTPNRRMQPALKPRWIVTLILLVTAILIIPALGCDRGGGGGGGGEDDPTTGAVNGNLTLPDRLLVDQDPRDRYDAHSTVNNASPGQTLPALSSAVGNVINGATVDPSDFYHVTLQNGDRITMKIADPDVDLDLYLYQGGTQVASSVTANAIETVTAASGDTQYVIEVRAHAAGSTYNLSVGLAPAAAERWIDSEFVIGQAIVRYRHAPSASAARGPVNDGIDPDGITLTSFPIDPDLDGRWAASGGADRGAGAPTRATAARATAVDAARSATLAMIDQLNQDPEVLSAEPNLIFHPLFVPDDVYYPRQWDLPLIHADLAWDVTDGESTVAVAVIDTGILTDHPDLSAGILKDGLTVVGYDFISNATAARDGNGIDPNPYDNGDKASGQSRSSFHGTHVSGTIAAAGDNGQGITGLAWNARIMPLRALGIGGGTDYDIIQAVKYAAGLPNDSGTVPTVAGVPRHADVINMSFGATGPCAGTAFQAAITAARNAGVIVVAAAGNGGTNAAQVPASCAGVIGVAAVDSADSPAPYSNYGAANVDLSAPGGNLSADLNADGFPDGILSTVGDDSSGTIVANGYAWYQGTSMAAPHVAGIAALMKSIYPALSPLQFDQLINGANPDPQVSSITTFAKGQWSDRLGRGVIDAEKAVKMAQYLAGGGGPTTPVLGLSSDKLNFGFIETALSTTAVNYGIGGLGAISVDNYSAQPFAPWLTSAVIGNTVSFTVIRANLPPTDGDYSASVTVRSGNGGAVSLAISVSKGAVVQSDAGFVYLQLIGVDPGGTVYQITASAAGDYAFSFTGVKPGRYILGGGTDVDEDWILGDNGELFGLYPSSDASQIITVTAGQTLVGADFHLQFVGLPIANQTGLSPATQSTPWPRRP